MKTHKTQDVINALEEIFGLTEGELTRKYVHAPRHIADPQCIAITILKEKQRLTYHQIKDIFHFRNHSSISHSLKKFNGFMDTNKNFSAAYQQINEKLETILNKQQHDKQKKLNQIPSRQPVKRCGRPLKRLMIPCQMKK